MSNHSDFEPQEFIKFSQVENDSLKVFHLNIRSFSSNILQFDHLLRLISHKIDIIILSEAWINNVETYKSFFQDYEMYFSGKINRAGGVIVLTYRENIKVHDFQVNCINESDSVVLNISYKNLKFQTIVALYRPPSTNFNRFIDSLIKNLDAHKNRVYLMAGDFNVDMKKYNTDAKSENLCDTLSEHGLMPVIQTRGVRS